MNTSPDVRRQRSPKRRHIDSERATRRCPGCGNDVPITPKRRQFQAHLPDGTPCFWDDPNACERSGTRSLVNAADHRASPTLFLRHKRIFGTIIAIIGLLGSITGLLAYIGIQPFDSAGASSKHARPQAPDPYSYIVFDGLDDPKHQDCFGLFGLCLYQSVQVALDAFGPNEAQDFPQADTWVKGATCHGWSPNRIRLVEVCGNKGEIDSIEVFFNEESQASLALPDNGLAKLPESIAKFARDLHRSSPDVVNLGYETPEGEGFVQASEAFGHDGAEGEYGVTIVTGRHAGNAGHEYGCGYKGFDRFSSLISATNIEVASPGFRDESLKYFSRKACAHG